MPKYELKMSRELLYNFRILEPMRTDVTKEVESKQILLPNPRSTKHSKKTLLVDLDDTLVHTMDPQLDYSSVNIDPSMIRETEYFDYEYSVTVDLKCVIRPYALKFIQEIRPFSAFIVLL